MFLHANKIFFALAIIGLASCANRAGGPQGGPQDMKAPQALGENPKNKSLNFKAKKIVIEFDEFLNLENPQEKVIISPPQIKPAEITAIGKRITIELQDSLKANSTYTVDFTNSISDVNERNTLKDYTYSFSTGNSIDTLQISGTVLEAGTLNPLKNQLVSIYADLNPKAFTDTIPLRISKTDEQGRFCIKNVKAGTYRIYALNDLNRDYFYNDPNEMLAFAEATLSPSVETVVEFDTIHIDKDKNNKPLAEHRDSIVEHSKQVFIPNNIVLKSFKEDIYKQYFIKAERKTAQKVSFYFFGENKERAKISPLNVKPSAKDLIIHSTKGDTIDYWFADSASFVNDTLRFSVEYKKPDSTGVMITKIDTITSFFKMPKPSKRAKKGKENKKLFLNIQTNMGGSLDVYNPIIIKFEEPVLSIDKSKFHLYSKVDSIWKEENIQLVQTDSVGMRYKIDKTWNPDLMYKLEADSACCFGYYNTHNNNLKQEFKVKGPEEYSTLVIKHIKFAEHGIVQLLDAKDAVIKQVPAKSEGTVFEHLKPGAYYLRMFIDANANGVWDTGNFSEQKQAETLYYLNTVLELKANWEIEQEWDYSLVPITEQKPAILLPQEKK